MWAGRVLRRVRGRLQTESAAGAFLALIFLLLLGAHPGAAYAADRWSDITDQEWESAYGITAAEAATVADGYSDGTFGPYQPVTRAQFAKMAVRGLGLPVVPPTSPSFSDVGSDHPLFAYVESARAAGVIGGYEDGTFRPDEAISRQQASSILARFLSEKELQVMGVIWGLELSYPSLEAWSWAEGSFYLGVFSDLAGLAAVHRPTSAYLVCHHVVKGALTGGKYYLYPTASLSRAQAVTMVLRAADAVSEVAPGAPPPPCDLSTFPTTPSAERCPSVSGKAWPGGTVMLFDTYAGETQLVAQGRADELTGAFSLIVPSDRQLAEGRHQFALRVRSEKGLLSEFSSPLEYVVDCSPPAAFVSSPEDGDFVPGGRPLFVVTATDNGAGVQDVMFKYAVDEGEAPVFLPISVDYSAPYLCSWGVLSLPEGAYLLCAEVRDKAGNRAETSAVSVVVDTTPPSAEIAAPLSPAAGEPVLTEERAPYFAATATDPAGTAGGLAGGVSEVQFLYAPKAGLPTDPTVGAFTLISAEAAPGETTSAEADTYVADWGGLELPDGRYLLGCVAFDRAGNASLLAAQELVVDTQAPQVQVLTPTEDEELLGGAEYLLRWSAEDLYFAPGPAGPVTIDFFNGEDWFCLAGGLASSGTYAWVVPDPPVYWEDCYIRVTAVDALGHAGSALSGRFAVRASGTPSP